MTATSLEYVYTVACQVPLRSRSTKYHDVDDLENDYMNVYDYMCDAPSSTTVAGNEYPYARRLRVPLSSPEYRYENDYLR